MAYNPANRRRHLGFQDTLIGARVKYEQEWVYQLTDAHIWQVLYHDLYANSLTLQNMQRTLKRRNCQIMKRENERESYCCRVLGQYYCFFDVETSRQSIR